MKGIVHKGCDQVPIRRRRDRRLQVLNKLLTMMKDVSFAVLFLVVQYRQKSFCNVNSITFSLLKSKEDNANDLASPTNPASKIRFTCTYMRQLRKCSHLVGLAVDLLNSLMPRRPYFSNR